MFECMLYIQGDSQVQVSYKVANTCLMDDNTLILYIQQPI